MRLNKYIAQATGISRRKADALIERNEITVNSKPAKPGVDVSANDQVFWQKRKLTLDPEKITILFNKPVGFVCSKDGQGSATVYDILPAKYRALKSVGRLDKESTGLLILTNDGQLAYRLTHPKFRKLKEYVVKLDAPLSRNDENLINKGIVLDDGVSNMTIKSLDKQNLEWSVKMTEGKNRQIRRTFSELGYTVVYLHRTKFGPYVLHDIAPGKYLRLE